MNTRRHHDHHELEPLLSALAEGTLSPTQRERLCEILREDAKARTFYQRYIAVHVMLQWEAGAGEAGDDPAGDLLHDLLLQEARAEVIDAPVCATAEQGDAAEATNRAPAEHVGIREVGQVLLYLGGRPKVWGPIAAIVALVVTLSIVITAIGPSTPSGPQTTQTPGDDKSPAVVATLTATRNATWAEGATAPGSPLTPGTPLRAGDRLTLTAGFAEITTKRGAVAILEAPATIELTDNDNALRLHAGKLVGICETDSSKGFVVRTPHMDITDLGTRFGVNVTGARVEATVLTGRIQMRDQSNTSHILNAKQTARIWFDHERPELVLEQQIAEGFESLLANPLIDPAKRLKPTFEGDRMAWGGPVPADLRFQKHPADRPQVFVERQALRLKEDVAVDLSPQHPDFNELLIGESPSIPAGSVVDVYLIHLDPPTDQEVIGEYIIYFDRPILGVVATGQNLIDTDATLGSPEVRYPDEALDINSNRGCEPSTERVHQANDLHDRIHIEGKTLTLRLCVAGYIDQMRVLVQAQQ